MKISGFTFVRDVEKLYYPFEESVQSILPIVDEFVIAVGDCSPNDRTLEIIERIQSPKIKVIHTIWDIEKYGGGTIYAQQTDVAKAACTGDWLFYLQADEVIHEKYLPQIVKRCEELLEDQEVEALLFKYKHFFGDYAHHIVSHGWYPWEIRIIRNRPDIHSFIDAQSFRRIPDFDGVHYKERKGSFHLKVASVDAEVYHYGWVRPPHSMQRKAKVMKANYTDEENAQSIYNNQPDYFDYGALGKIEEFKENHPAIMTKKIATFDWKDQLNYTQKHQLTRPKMKHERLKYQVLTFFEQRFLGGRLLFGYKNWKILRGK